MDVDPDIEIVIKQFGRYLPTYFSIAQQASHIAVSCFDRGGDVTWRLIGRYDNLAGEILKTLEYVTNAIEVKCNNADHWLVPNNYYCWNIASAYKEGGRLALKLDQITILDLMLAGF